MTMTFSAVCLRASVAILAFITSLQAVPVAAHEEHPDPLLLSSIQRQKEPAQVIRSRHVEVSAAEQEVGIVNLEQVLPILRQVNNKHPVFSAKDFEYFVANFHYPFRERFFLGQHKPPAHVVLHWTANKHTHIPLYTLSAFLRRGNRGRVVERPNRYKNVSNYFLTGSLVNLQGEREAHLVKLTRGDIKSWGDIPRVTAYPTDDQHDDNKYDGRGALGIEIESPNFRDFYYNPQQRAKLDQFLQLVLTERGVADQFYALRDSEHWEGMQALYRYLRDHLADMDVNQRGGIHPQFLFLDKIASRFPDLSPQVYYEATRIFSYISGHGIVAREYNHRMRSSGRHREANYSKIDFTEPHVFVIAMELLNKGPADTNPYRNNPYYNPYQEQTAVEPSPTQSASPSEPPSVVSDWVSDSQPLNPFDLAYLPMGMVAGTLPAPEVVHEPF
jgi:hypothetical protein